VSCVDGETDARVSDTHVSLFYIIKEKKDDFSRMHLNSSVDNIEFYKVIKKTV
jgi:hypothetical protein